MKVKCKSQLDCMNLNTILNVLGISHNTVIGFGKDKKVIYAIIIFDEIKSKFILELINIHGEIK